MILQPIRTVLAITSKLVALCQARFFRAAADAQIQAEWLTAPMPTPQSTLTAAGEPEKLCAF